MSNIVRLKFVTIFLGYVAAMVTGSTAVLAQATPTASRSVDFSAFAGLTGTYTGLSNGRNAGVTAGADLNLPARFGVRPSIEVRATAPFDRGTVDGQKDILAGLKGEMSFGRLHPYADFLIGRGEISYVNPYVTYAGTFFYGRSTSTVISPGLGARFYLGNNFSAFGDVQLQHWDTPVSLSGHLLAKPFTAGLVYRFAYGHRGR